MRKLITVTELRQLTADGKQAVIPPDSVLTPSAIDMAKEMGIALVWEQKGEKAARKLCAPPARPSAEAGRVPAAKETPAGCPELGESDIRLIVRKVLDQTMKPACPNPRVTMVKGDSVVLEPFTEAPPGQDIRLKDVVTAREANLCAGFMAFDHSRLPWQLSYDEVDYVVEGVFTVQADGKTYTLNAGDILYIPKDTKVVFSSTEKARVFYVTYPANWADLKA